uniref:PH domain-containing protein n=1 Tax=Ascaris lumbricoides TaxID=6252 RepID=A0A9J2P596_ASCLU
MSVGLLKNDGSPTAPSSDALSATLRLAPLRHSFPAYMRLLTSASIFRSNKTFNAIAMLNRHQSFGKNIRESSTSASSIRCENPTERRNQMGPIHEGFMHVFRGRFFAKWKRFMGAVFDENSTGHARLELYGSDKQLATINPAKTVLFSECIAIRIVTFESKVYIYAERSIARNFVAIGTQPSSSLTPCFSGDYAVPADVKRIPVVLQRISGTARPQLPEGDYDMYLNQCLVISNAFHSVKWEYLQITWFATGYNCFALEIAKEGRYEFSSSQPMAPLRALRYHTNMTNIETPPRFITKNHYDYYYIPSRMITAYPPRNSQVDFEEVESVDHDSKVDNRASEASGYDTRMDQFNTDLRRSPRLPFFHRHANSSQHERSDFEMNANDEWIRYKVDNGEGVDKGGLWKRSQNEVRISKPLEFEVHLDEVIAANKVLQLAQMDDTSPPPLPPKATTQLRIPCNGQEPLRNQSNDYVAPNRFPLPSESTYSDGLQEPPPPPPRSSKV